MKYIIGVDLGTINDFTSIAVLRQEGQTRGSRVGRIRSFRYTAGRGFREERLKERPAEQPRAHYSLVHLERHLGEPYTEMVRRVQSVAERLDPTPAIVVDATGVGRPVVDVMIEAGLRRIVPVVITGGSQVTDEWVGGRTEYRVPKRDLVGTLQVLLQNRLLKIAAAIDYRDELVAEMQNFRAKMNMETGHTSFEHWRSGDHDDLVLALTLACWYAENHM